MFLDNQGQEPVWFDSLYIEALKPKKALIVQENHYDPYGNPILPLHYLAEAQEMNPSMYQGKELDSLLQAYDFEARLYDPLTGRFMSSDPADQFASGYTGMGNNPVVMVDPDGRMAWFVPVLIGAAIGGTMGGIKAVNRDMSFMGGFLKGAIVGAVGGAASLVGGGPLITNIAYGAFEGAMVGALDAAVWGDDMLQSVKMGAITGGAFATTTSLAESFKNASSGFGFGTNEGRLNTFVKDYHKAIGTESEIWKAEKAIRFIQKRHGLGTSVKISYDRNLDVFGETDAITGDIRIGPLAFENSSLLKATAVHEYGHSVLDRILDNNGKFVEWQYDFNYNAPSALLKKDGALGYAQEIYNSGRLHIQKNVITDWNPLWKYWKPGRDVAGKWWYGWPRRFGQNALIKPY